MCANNGCMPLTIYKYIGLIIKTACYTGTGVRWWTIDIHSLPTHTTCCQKPVNQCRISPVTLDTSRSSTFQRSPTTAINCLNKNIPQKVSGWTNPLESTKHICASQLRSFPQFLRLETTIQGPPWRHMYVSGPWAHEVLQSLLWCHRFWVVPELTSNAVPRGEGELVAVTQAT